MAINGICPRPPFFSKYVAIPVHGNGWVSEKFGMTTYYQLLIEPAHVEIGCRYSICIPASWFLCLISSHMFYWVQVWQDRNSIGGGGAWHSYLLSNAGTQVLDKVCVRVKCMAHFYNILFTITTIIIVWGEVDSHLRTKIYIIQSFICVIRYIKTGRLEKNRY